jgi:hypothetical protein
MSSEAKLDWNPAQTLGGPIEAARLPEDRVFHIDGGFVSCRAGDFVTRRRGGGEILQRVLAEDQPDVFQWAAE